jgi:peptidoglycan L-alanyl-D-glutamate endopeptidase CwlK
MVKTSRTTKLLETLTPEARAVISDLLELGYKNGMNAQVHSAYRSPAEQDKLYAQGRTLPGKIVTNARGTPVAQSSHCYRLAVDIHFDMNKDGIAEWDMALYQKLWDLAEKAGLDKKGLRWGGNWKSFREGPHFEVTSGKTWQQLAGQKTDPVPAKEPEKAPEVKKTEAPKPEPKKEEPAKAPAETPKAPEQPKPKKKAENESISRILTAKK